MEEKRLRRPVRLADFLVVGSEFVHNIAKAFYVASDELLHLSIYNANRETELNEIWEDFSTDLETIPEDTDGA